MARNQHRQVTQRGPSGTTRGAAPCAAALAALVLLAARTAAAEVLEGWPCAGCETVIPAPPAPRDAGPPAEESGRDAEASGPAPRPLLVALHGDGGGVRPLVRAWKAAAAAAGVILLAPRCPRELGCTAGSWWQWLDTAGHDPAWLGAQIDAVAARFAVDPRRVFATGYSGGATYLGWYAPAHPLRFAAVAHVAGGAAYRPACPACKVPVLFVLGAADPMIGPYTRPLRDWYEGCGGHEILWETLPGVTHESILQVLEAGRARQILTWLLARPAACEETTTLDAGPAPPSVPAVTEALDAGAAVPAPPPHAGSAPPRVPPAGAGCACGSSGSSAPPAPVGGSLVLALASALRRRRAVGREVLAPGARPR